MTTPAAQRFGYTTQWNEKLRKPVLNEVWLTESEARERFEVSHRYFQVLDPIALDPVALATRAPSFILEIRSNETGRLVANKYNDAGSIKVAVDLRVEGERYFVDQVTSWTYPDETQFYGMSGNTSITTYTFEPDGNGTFSLRDKLDPTNDMRLGARDIPVEEHWIDRFEFGRWDVLLNLPMLTRRKGPLR